MEIGKRIAELRKERKWTQLELAEKLFVTDKAVSKWVFYHIVILNAVKNLKNVSLCVQILRDAQDDTT